MLGVVDGESLVELFKGGTPKRNHPIPFVFQKNAALIDGEYKLLSTNVRTDSEWKLYNLKDDTSEADDLSAKFPERFERMKAAVTAMMDSVETSAAGKDYPEGKIVQPPRKAFWTDLEAYEPYFEKFSKRPEYESMLKKAYERIKG